MQPETKLPEGAAPEIAEEKQEDTRTSLPLEALKSALPYLIALAVIGIGGYWLIDPAPPKKIVLAVSRQDANDKAYAAQYAELLKEDGITLELRETDGPMKSLDVLHEEDSGVDMAFLEGGVATQDPDAEADSEDLVSLGSLYYEPIWVFCGNKRKITHLAALKGKRIAVGRNGSSTGILTAMLLNAAGVNSKNSTLLQIGEDEAAEALRQGKVDAVFISGVPTLPLVQKLATMPNVAMADLDEAEAYSRRFTFLHHLVLPEGALNLETNLPPHPVNLLAPTVTLVASDSMHPALIYLVLKTVSRVHGGAGMLQHEHEFPADKDTDFELSSQARKFYESGPPFFDRYLPFWAATFINRVLIILLPLIALAIPLSRIIPAIYIWLIKSRIYKLYGELRYLEMQLRSPHQPLEPDTFSRELDDIEYRVNHMHLPVAFSSHLYELRSHIALVRSQLK
jgi:TRAP transporter TAXI family solute receptor